VNLGWLAQIINHPGVSLGAGGTVGGVIGTLVMQPSCQTVYETTSIGSRIVCSPPTLPLLGAVEPLTGVAILTGWEP
jgi:hypothetical protein